MFDRERAITDWRRKLDAAGIRAVVVDELESHLREDLDALMSTGLNEQQAFKAAGARIGDLQTLKAEFSAEQKVTRAILLAAIGSYVPITLIPVFFRLGSFADVTPTQQMSALAAVVVTVIGFFAGRLFGRVLLQVSKRAILIVSAAATLLLSAWLAIFFYHAMTSAEWDISQLVVAILWAMSPISFSSVLFGMEEAAAARSSHV